jgi:fucose permease
MKQGPLILEKSSCSPPYRWQIGLAFFAFIVIGANDGAVGVLIPDIRGHYAVDKAVVSWLFLCGSSGYLIAALSSGWLVKKLGQRRFLLLGGSALIVGALSISLTPPFAFLALPFFLVGFGIATLDTGLNAYMANLPRSAERLNYLHAFYGVGALLGPVIASAILVAGFAWNDVYSLWGILSLFFFLGVVFAFKETMLSARRGKLVGTSGDATGGGERTGASPVPTVGGEQLRGRIARVRLVPLGEMQQPVGWDEMRDKRSSMGEVLRLPVTWIVAFFLFFYVGVEVSLGTWIYSFLTEQRQEPALFSAWMVSGYWIGLTLGRIVLAQLVTWLSERRAIQIGVIGAMLGVLLTWLIPTGMLSALGICLTGFCLGPIFPTTMALMPKLFSQRLLATAIGLVASLGGLGGTLFPWLSGNLAQAFGLWIILPLAIAMTVMMFLLWILFQFQQTSSV